LSGPVVSRRSFILGSASALAAAASGVGIPPVASAAVAQAVPAVAPVLRDGGSWGFSTCGDVWSTGYCSREEALDHAMWEGHNDEEVSVEIGYCVPDRITIPQGASEDMAEWLSDPRGGLGRILRETFMGSNEEIDWEGEFSDAVSAAEHRSMDAPAAAAVAACLARLGRSSVAVAVLACDQTVINLVPFETEDDVLEAVSGDEALSSDLAAIMAAWVKRSGLSKAGRTLRTSDVSSVALVYDEDSDEYRLADDVMEMAA
jgi:hypothetical protein